MSNELLVDFVAFGLVGVLLGSYALRLWHARWVRRRATAGAHRRRTRNLAGMQAEALTGEHLPPSSFLDPHADWHPGGYIFNPVKPGIAIEGVATDARAELIGTGSLVDPKPAEGLGALLLAAGFVEAEPSSAGIRYLPATARVTPGIDHVGALAPAFVIPGLTAQVRAETSKQSDALVELSRAVSDVLYEVSPAERSHVVSSAIDWARSRARSSYDPYWLCLRQAAASIRQGRGLD